MDDQARSILTGKLRKSLKENKQVLDSLKQIDTSLLLAQSTMRIFTTESFCLEYLSGATRLLEVHK